MYLYKYNIMKNKHLQVIFYVLKEIKSRTLMFPLDLSISRSIPSHYIYRDITLFDLCFMFPSFNIFLFIVFIHISSNSTRIKVSCF